MRNRAIAFFAVGLGIGLLGGMSVPYLFNLVAMLLRHCGGM